MSGPYTITGEASSPRLGAASFTRNTAKDAVIKAIEMMGAGMQNVLIVDAQNRVYSHPQFAALTASEGA